MSEAKQIEWSADTRTVVTIAVAEEGRSWVDDQCEADTILRQIAGSAFADEAEQRAFREAVERVVAFVAPEMLGRDDAALRSDAFTLRSALARGVVVMRGAK